MIKTGCFSYTFYNIYKQATIQVRHRDYHGAVFLDKKSVGDDEKTGEKQKYKDLKKSRCQGVKKAYKIL